VPLDWVFHQPRNVPQDKILYVRDLRRQINAAYDHARKCMLSALRRQKRDYDRGVRNVEYKPGQFVMCHDKTKKVGRNPALRPRWRGPYIIMDMRSSATAVIQMSAKDRLLTVHVDRLKHCFPPRKGAFRWAEEQLRRKFPGLTLDFQDEGANLPEMSEQATDHELAEAQQEGSGSPDIGEGSGMSSLTDTTQGSSDSAGGASGSEDAKAGKLASSQPRRKLFIKRRDRQRPHAVGDPSNADLGLSSEGEGDDRDFKGGGNYRGSGRTKGPVKDKPTPKVVITRKGRISRPPVRLEV
jgi:hypothetical protein